MLYHSTKNSKMQVNQLNYGLPKIRISSYMGGCTLVHLIVFLLTITNDVWCMFGNSRNVWQSPQEVNYREEEKKILDSVLSVESYDKRIRPSGLNSTDSATLVDVNIFVRSFSAIDDVKMEYSFQITLRQQWNDNRLRYKEKLEEDSGVGDLARKYKIYYIMISSLSRNFV